MLDEYLADDAIRFTLFELEFASAVHGTRFEANIAMPSQIIDTLSVVVRRKVAQLVSVRLRIFLRGALDPVVADYIRIGLHFRGSNTIEKALAACIFCA